jgi:hypothetical protein
LPKKFCHSRTSTLLWVCLQTCKNNDDAVEYRDSLSRVFSSLRHSASAWHLLSSICFGLCLVVAVNVADIVMLCSSSFQTHCGQLLVPCGCSCSALSKFHLSHSLPQQRVHHHDDLALLCVGSVQSCNQNGLSGRLDLPAVGHAHL